MSPCAAVPAGMAEVWRSEGAAPSSRRLAVRMSPIRAGMLTILILCRFFAGNMVGLGLSKQTSLSSLVKKLRGSNRQRWAGRGGAWGGKYGSRRLSSGGPFLVIPPGSRKGTSPSPGAPVRSWRQGHGGSALIHPVSRIRLPVGKRKLAPRSLPKDFCFALT